MPKVLIVDDEKHIRLLYAEELEEDGYKVALASDGVGILERIEKEGPDVVVLDIKMVSSNGLDVLQEIRNRFYNLPVILCSAYGSYKVDIKSIAADAYVVKSSDLTELKNKIAQVLETTVPMKE
ncbi:MAG: response regulator [Syntrophaceae bacterium]|nr:response regulator [Deltaproteobacteria bacterium]